MDNKRRHTVALILIGIAVLLIGIILKIRSKEKPPLRPQYRLEVIEHWASAWSYEIYYGDQLQIKQEFVPGIRGKKHFTSKEEARIVGTLVLDRLIVGKSPVVHVEDLKKNGISH
ncbi:DUF4907 domain-containing protein [Spongiimicrobium sp. 2-473A-2-J]|uniref:DUF4907 domain-containing protein n=1 Tax=Eudoraea algarum TaxID=3417568 RepID=UPI003D36E1A5